VAMEIGATDGFPDVAMAADLNACINYKHESR